MDNLFTAQKPPMEDDQPDPELRDKRISPMDGPIPGESLTGKPETLPFEKPPQFAEVEEGLDFIFSKLMNRRTAAEMLAYMESGIPVDMLAHSIIMSGFGEGKWPVTAVHMLAGPTVVMLTKMAEAAKIKWYTSTDQELEDRIPEAIERLTAEKVKTGPADTSILMLDKLQRGGMPAEKGMNLKGVR